MDGRLLVVTLAAALTFAGCITDPVTPTATQETAPTLEAADDVVVIAVVDGGINPYHLDWAASTMPQHLDDDPTNDLPLTETPAAWLPGFDAPSGGVHALNLTLPTDPKADVAELLAKDASAIDGIAQSSGEDVHLYYIPGTKIVGVVDFAGSGAITNSGAHGAKAASVSTGNVYGSCPECLLVFVNNAGEAGLEWAASQDWIDVVTNSYGFSTVNRDRLYSGSDVELQRTAIERGQAIFFSAGNGQENAFLVPNPTLFSSQEGPDWIITVGAVGPNGRASYTGHGKPADVASIGSSYPSQGGTTPDGEGTFGGTSSATPTSAGTYARALHWAREALAGPSRVQANGTIAQGEPIACGAAYAQCELADGILTGQELRTRFLHGAVHTPLGVSVVDQVNLPPLGEDEFVSEGHGTYFGRMDGDETWNAELARITGPLVGETTPLVRPDGEAEWMTVDSWCRQHLWGAWSQGYYVEGNSTLPGPDPLWPLRTAILTACPHLFPPV